MQEATTPLMKQYRDIKSRFPDTLLFFQVGDFYELFFDDAKQASAFLGITLTKRGKNNGEPIPLCGVPVHALDHYMTKLVRGGFKVALCDQLEQATPGKMVERGVTRVLTPGTLTDTALLDEKSASYLFSFFPLANSWGLLFGELLTAQLYATVLPESGERILESELVRFFPDEILLPPSKQGKQFQPYFKQLGYFTSLVDFNQHNEQEIDSVTTWLQQFKAEARATLESHEALRLAAYNFYAYLRTTHEASLAHFNQLQFYKPDDFLLLDAATQRTLELVKNSHDSSRSGTLFSVMDDASTAMGSRLIRKWLMRPLVKQEMIVQRYDAVHALMSDSVLMQQLKDALVLIGDIERVVGRIGLRRASVGDYILLMNALEHIPRVGHILRAHEHASLIKLIIDHCGDFSQLRDLLYRALNDDASKEWIIKEGFDTRLDATRDLVATGNNKIVALEAQEQAATGINSLKIRYNQVHGYSIEITKTHYDAVPAHYIRRQTLVGRERFTTAELQQLEHAIAHARTEIVTLEQEIFESIKQAVSVYVGALRKIAYAIANLDALLSFACIAYDHGYVRPVLTTDRDIIITQGRHPVVERTLASGFIPNDTRLTDDQSLWIITGPNMGGKSTYLRQVALLSIMAQCGSFIPAVQAQLPILDRIFTRIGAGDNLVGGKSTFMVEMEETASICTQSTKHSLVILDEVGRGTSTFDGLAIAQAVVEHIYSRIGARCLFATHYHELTNLQEQHPGIVSYYAASTKTPAGIIFLYKMIKGVADGSFGVEVAKLAALPPTVIARAATILHGLTHEASYAPIMQSQQDASVSASDSASLYKLQQLEQLAAALNAVDYDNLSPKQALDLVWRLKELS